MKKYNAIKNSNLLKDKLTKIVEEIYSTEDPQVLNEYRTFFKKQVGFFSRSYVAGYLLKKYIAETATAGTNKQNQRKNADGESKGSGTRRVSLNMGSRQASEAEFTQYLASLPDIAQANATITKQTSKHTVLTINAQYTKEFLTAVRNKEFKNKKLYVDLRGWH